MADDRPDAREQQRGTGSVAGEHVVRAAFVSRLTMRHRADDGQLVGDVGRLDERVAKQLTANLRGDLLHLTSVFNRSVRLGIERFLMSHPTGQVDVND